MILGVVAPKAHRIEDVIAPGYLAERVKRGTSGDVRPGAIVWITSEVHAFIVELYIVGVDKAAEAVQSIVLRAIDLRECEVISEDYSEATVADLGEQGWIVKLHGRTARVGFKTESEARAFIDARSALARGGKPIPSKEPA